MKKTKQIAIIVKYFYPVAAGIETNILETYSVLVEKGWGVTVYTTTDTLSSSNELPPEDEIRGIKIKRYPYQQFRFFRQIPLGNTDILAMHNFNILPQAYLMIYSYLLKLVGRKRYSLVLTPHGGFNPEWSIFPFFTRLVKKTYHYTLGTFLINLSVDSVRAVSEWEGAEITKKGVRKSLVTVIPNGVEKEAYMPVDSLASKEIKSKVKKYGKYILQIGRVYKIKNYETSILALTKLPKDINYVIAGPIQEDKKYLDKLDKLIKVNNLENRVIFHGVLRGVDKYYLIKHAQLMIHMALWESFCNVVHEGLSQGLVCIVANNTALPYLIKHGVNGFCIQTRNFIEVAKKINYVLLNKNTKEIINMEKRNKIYGLENSWTNVAERVDKLYENLENT